MSEEEQKTESVFDLDAPQEIENVSSFLNKESLVGKRTKAKILNIVPGQFKHPLLVLEINGEEFRLDLNKTNKNFLVKTFGKIPRDWIDAEFYLTAETGMYNIDGNQQEGISVKFTL